MVEYLKPEDARKMTGLRLVLTMEAFGPWGQAMKKMLEYKKVPYIPVGQVAGAPNEELVAWTGTRNAPTIIYNDEPPLSRWFDQIPFIEKLAPTPPLVPADSASRAKAFGIVNEIAGEWGFGWCSRLLMFNFVDTASKGAPPPMISTLMGLYGYGAQTVDNAPARIVDIITTLAKILHEQKAKGSDYFVGSQLSIADIYWASFSYMVELLPDDIHFMPEDMRALRECKHPDILAAKDPILIAHRNKVFREHLGKCEF